MSDLSPEHYEQVLKYMETANEDNFETATLVLQQHDFNLERAIQNKFSQEAPRQRAARPQGPSDEEIIRKYVQFVTRRNAESSFFGSIFGGIKTIVLTILGIFSSVCIPQNVRIRYFGSDFQRLYLGRLPNIFTGRSLPSLLKQTRNVNSRSVLLLISPVNIHPNVLAFLSKAELQKSIARNFWLTGHNLNHPELAKIERVETPMLIALRETIFEQVVEIGRTKQLGTVDSDLLDRWAHEGRNLFKRDCNVLVKYRNFVSRAFGHFYEEEEEEEVNLADFERNTQEIQQQNRAYQEIEEQAKKIKQMEEEKAAKEKTQARKKEELLAEREARKSSLPDEPSEGEIVRLSFRCPDGSTIVRNFHSDEKLDLIFQWVELNDEIEFQDEKRDFEIMHSYPPQPLSDRKEELISSVFDSPQQKLVIREL